MHCETTIYAARSAVLRYRRGRIPTEKSLGLAPKTVKNVHRMISRALDDAVAWRYIERNPAPQTTLPRGGQRSKLRPGSTWTPEELAAWLKVAVTDRDAGVWVLAATTGMRRSELAGADRGLLDLNSATLWLADTRIVVSGKTQESDGKTEAGDRMISLDEFTVTFLEAHLARLDEEREAFGRGYSMANKLVCHPDGRPVHPETITRRFNRLVDRAGVRRIRLHDVRHTYATIALDAGVDPKILIDRLGQSNLASLQIYTHRSHGKDRQAAATVAALIFPKTDS